jgi:endogenous inhibitor of DNA gyrase (YacG/DUF329 family)
MPTVRCPDCGRDIGMHELETKTVARRDGFATHYRCPYCRSAVEDVADGFG